MESRYGIWSDRPSTSALITFPRADKDRLILLASFNLCGRRRSHHRIVEAGGARRGSQCARVGNSYAYALGVGPLVDPLPGTCFGHLEPYCILVSSAHPLPNNACRGNDTGSSKMPDREKPWAKKQNKDTQNNIYHAE